jgi:hypothetical protein
MSLGLCVLGLLRPGIREPGSERRRIEIEHDVAEALGAELQALLKALLKASLETFLPTFAPPLAFAALPALVLDRVHQLLPVHEELLFFFGEVAAGLRLRDLLLQAYHERPEDGHSVRCRAAPRAC